MEKLNNFTLLLVEDNDTLRDELYEILDIFFKKVYTAKNGQDGLEVYNNKIIDVVISDYVMPIMNGYEMASELKKINEDLPIVIMSNYSDRDKLLNLLKLNLTEFLIKPVDYNKIQMLLKKLSKKFEDKQKTYKLNDELIYNALDKKIIRNDEEIKLTKNEIILIDILVNKINKVVTFEELEYAFGENFYKSPSAIKNIVYRLKNKTNNSFIKNIQGLGYTIEN